VTCGGDGVVGAQLFYCVFLLAVSQREQAARAGGGERVGTRGRRAERLHGASSTVDRDERATGTAVGVRLTQTI
jgi:hypothetical protein